MTNQNVIELAIQSLATGQGLHSAMKAHPELFAHINQESKSGNSPDEWVTIAEKLAKENGGTLQCYGWLVNNGYIGLSKAMIKYPEKFAHINQENKSGKKPEEWVPIAEKLAKENGGTLKYCKWLQKNGYNGLDQTMRKYPELFAHINQESKKNSPEEWVSIAKKMAKENSGTLQCGNWLRNNGYSGLDYAIKNNPELFANIRQESKRNNPEEWVQRAENLAKENGGTLQHSYWLQKNGYANLDVAMRKYPELFSHIKQDRKRRKVE